jgi:hypothetical protein
MSLVSVVCCQVEVSAMSWSFVQRSPTECVVSKKCVIVKPRKMRWHRPPRGCRAIGKKINEYFIKTDNNDNLTQIHRKRQFNSEYCKEHTWIKWVCIRTRQRISTGHFTSVKLRENAWTITRYRIDSKNTIKSYIQIKKQI